MTEIGSDRLIEASLAAGRSFSLSAFCAAFKACVASAMLVSDADMRNRLDAGAGCEPKERWLSKGEEVWQPDKDFS